MLFPHPSASRSASGFMLLTRCLPRVSNGLANTTATLGSFYWLGFETSGLSPDKKRLAWLGAQRRAHPPLSAGAKVELGMRVVATEDHRNTAAGRGWMVRLDREKEIRDGGSQQDRNRPPRLSMPGGSRGTDVSPRVTSAALAHRRGVALAELTPTALAGRVRCHPTTPQLSLNPATHDP